MGGPRTNRRSSKPKAATAPTSRITKAELISNITAKEKYLEIFVIAVLFAFGVYHSILYFGHQVVPNTDFTAFIGLARRLLSFQLPTSYKRAPVLGLLQVGLSYFVGGQHPDLTAGRLLNAILHPFNILLFWLIAKRIVGRAAPWLVIIAIINPWTIQLLTEPIVETTLLFFTLLTFYFMFKRSNFCYLFASITTMVRYEGAALILAAFVMDMISCENKKQRILAFVYSAIASVPLMLWMLGTVMNWQSQMDTYYLKDLGIPGTLRDFLLKYVVLIWQMAFYQLFLPTPKAPQEVVELLLKLSKMLVAGSFLFGVVYGLLKRRWEILAFLIFLLPYIFAHAAYKVVIPRYCMPIYWIVLLICLYALQSIWNLINKDNRVPPAVTRGLQAVLLIIAFIWFIKLVPYLPKIAPMSRQSASMPYVAIGVVAAIYIARRFIYKARYSWRDAAVTALVCLMIVSNQFLLVRVVGNGQRDIEFKRLADWYIANAKPGEKLLCTLANVVRIFAPQHKDSLISIGVIKAENPSDFVRKCLDENITYVTWDSRVGLGTSGLYYKLWGIKNMAMLAEPRNVGPYEFITTIRASKRRFINVFRLRKMLPAPPSEQ